MSVFDKPIIMYLVMMSMLFVILRGLDIYSTYNCMAVGCSVESNPFMNYFISLGLPVFVLVNILLSLGILYLFIKTRENKLSKVIFPSFIALNTLVIINNYIPAIYLYLQ